MHFKFGEPEKVNRAKQKASVSWIIQKAHKNKVPGEFKDPYYKDYEGQEHLKPNIVHRLANADFYCSALANIYGDPSFHNLSHWNIIQALARKGVYVAEPTDVALTETVLIQTTPIKMSAHLAVIEAMMSLYIREVVMAERVVQAIQRIAGPNEKITSPQDQEEALVLWIDYASRNLQRRMRQYEHDELPVFPKIQDLSDLIDGIGLCTLISYYCPLELNWEDIAVADPPSMADSLYNIGLVIRFCQDSLPYNPCLLAKEDIVYMHSSVKQNILGFIAELFFLFELEPVSAVAITSTRRTSLTLSQSQLSSPSTKSEANTNIRRSHSINLADTPDNHSRSLIQASHKTHSDHGRESSMSDGQDEFVVQKARGYSTLSDMISNHSPTRYDPREVAKDKYNFDTKDEEPSQERGRLSRKGSFRDSSQELNAVPAAGLPTKSEEKRLYGRSRSRRNSINADESQLTIENFGGSQDNLNYIGRNPDKETYVHSGKVGGELSRSSSQTRDIPKRNLHRPSVEENTFDSSDSEESDHRSTNFHDSSRDNDPVITNPDYNDHSKTASRQTDKKTSFAALPNQTTWKQQSQSVARNIVDDDDSMEPQVMSSELHNVRMKLEEKRRRIESEKKKVELMMDKTRQKLGREAFMQAVVKGDVGKEVSSMSKKWLEDKPTEELRPSEAEDMSYSEYQNSLSQMTDSLTDIQSDIQRLSQQQHQIQTLMHNGMQPTSQFYLHDQQMNSPNRRVWGQNADMSMSQSTRRPQWGPPTRPMVPPHADYMMPPGIPQSSYYPQYQMPRHHNTGQLPPITPMQSSNQSGFILHGQPQSLPAGHQPMMYPNYYPPDHSQYRYVEQSFGESPRVSGQQSVPFRLHTSESPQRQVNDEQLPPHSQSVGVKVPQENPSHKLPSPSHHSHAPVAAPPPDDMEPQKIDFIESDSQNRVTEKLKGLSISSGSRTYRVREQASPTRHTIGTKTFRVPTKRGLPVHDDVDLPQPPPKERSLSPAPLQKQEEMGIIAEPLQSGSDKGFYISFEDACAPKKPKPQLRSRKMTQRRTSIPNTPVSTPSDDQPPPVPGRTRRGTRKSNERPDDYSFPRRDSDKLPSAKLSVFTPPSSVSSTSPTNNRSPMQWTPQTPYSSTNIFSQPKQSDYHTLFDRTESDEASDLTDDGGRTRTRGDGASGIALVFENDHENENSVLSEMEKKKERLMMQSMRRKQQQEEAKRKKEIEAEIKREAEKEKDDEKLRKKEEERARREIILERHKIKKAIEEAEKEGRYYNPPAWYYEDSTGTTTPTGKSTVRLRPGRSGGSKPRPRTMHETCSDSDHKTQSSRGPRGSSQNVSETDGYLRKNSRRWGSSSSLYKSNGTRGSTGSLHKDPPSMIRTDLTHSGRKPTLTSRTKRPSLYGSRDIGMNSDVYAVHEVRRPSVVADAPRSTSTRNRYRYDNPSRKYRSTGNLYGIDQDSMLYHMSEDSGLGRATPPRRAPSPGMSSRHFPSPAGPGSLPPGLFSKRRHGALDDNASDISVSSSTMDYCGPRLFKQPMAKSNRSIILNAVEYCVFPGVVNQNAKQRVLEEIARSESKYFLFLFRDSGCQFRAIYSYNPETDEVDKIYGTGPKQVTDTMFEKFFKYNSGGKCFSQIHTKHLTVTIDAFTIYNSLWQGKRVALPSKRDMRLVI